jgi:L-aspartate oxidase
MSGASEREFDLLIVGSGIGGMTAAITAADRGLRVGLLSKELNVTESNTRYAQGGIVGPSDEDTPELLENDIVVSGDRMNSIDAVRVLVQEGPALVESLLRKKLGVDFSKAPTGEIDLTREAAHSVRRIYHVTDATGRAIEDALADAVAKSGLISVLPHATAIDLITNVHNSGDPQEKYRRLRVIGLYALDNETSQVRAFFAPHVVLATGGVGNLFLHTSNPDGATGDGLAMAYRIGAEVLNSEYVQFHPTVLYHRDARRFLITESLRGEGARLLNRDGEQFMSRYIPGEADLGPRDEVSRAIYREMEREDSDHVHLDATRITGLDLATRFPTIHSTCLSHGIDIQRQPIPVVPAAHYFCGGIKVDLQGRTSIDGLYAVGEVACTGVHGANRLASVSLLEAMLWGHRCGEFASAEDRQIDRGLLSSIPAWVEPRVLEEFDPVLVSQDFHTVQSIMWNYAGIIRSRKRLTRAQADLDYLSHRIDQFYRSATLTKRIIELRNAVLASILIVRSALANPISKGCHFIE